MEGWSPAKNLVGTGNMARGSNFRDAEPLSSGYVIRLFGSDFSVFMNRGSTIQKQKRIGVAEMNRVAEIRNLGENPLFLETWSVPVIYPPPKLLRARLS